LIRFTVIATARLQQLEPLIGGTPPRSFPKREEARFGMALYLRPFLSGTELRIGRPNKPRRLLPQRAGTPDVALEDALYACLFPHFVVSAIGGAASSFGAGRLAMVSADPEGWKEAFDVVYMFARLIVLVPHASAGVAWEIDELHRRGSLDRTLLVMPPASSNYDVAALWSDAVQLCNSHGLQVPVYDPEGALLLMRADGGIRERWSFDLVWRNRLALPLHRVLPPAPASADADA
jgi:hypothetical protein